MSVPPICRSVCLGRPPIVATHPACVEMRSPIECVWVCDHDSTGPAAQDYLRHVLYVSVSSMFLCSRELCMRATSHQTGNTLCHHNELYTCVHHVLFSCMRVRIVRCTCPAREPRPGHRILGLSGRTPHQCPICLGACGVRDGRLLMCTCNYTRFFVCIYI